MTATVPIRCDYETRMATVFDYEGHVAVKRYWRGKQFGSVRKLNPNSSDEEIQRAEDAALLDTLHPAWVRGGFF